MSAAAAAGVLSTRKGWAQTPGRDPAKLARVAIMSLSFGNILKNANQPDGPLDEMQIADQIVDIALNGLTRPAARGRRVLRAV